MPFDDFKAARPNFATTAAVIALSVIAAGCSSNKQASKAYPGSSDMAKSLAIIRQALSPQPYSVASMQDLTPEDAGQKKLLSMADQQAVLVAFDELAAGHQSTNPPTISKTGRWSDLPLALYYAFAEAEMAAVETNSTDSSIECRFRTIEGWPGHLLVERCERGSVYHASAVVGWTDDHPKRADELLKALDIQMRAFARKRGFDD